MISLAELADEVTVVEIGAEGAVGLIVKACFVRVFIGSSVDEEVLTDLVFVEVAAELTM